MKLNQTVTLGESVLTDELLSKLIALSEDWERENSCHGYRKNNKSDIEGNRVFTAFAGDALVGYLFGHAEKSKRATSIMPEGASYFEVEELYVKPAYRDRGIGKRLFSCAESAVSSEVDHIMLSTATKNWRAILHFYIDELDMEFWNARLYKKIGKGETT